ncbi:hypothetical protein GALMADRAFT_277256 [Galerina marginata CBS 339.88]|uniref:Uncharacterized protein n=1 Tax=Galerina marginata (strain CBS 339.88) TaxID=685588 RepID=A0A067TLR7_GALM3|nr:hypothetical protein GALMADRAFT_277256 [Galerina marginata CBS 339.88]
MAKQDLEELSKDDPSLPLLPLESDISAETNLEVVVTQEMQGDNTAIDSFPVSQARVQEDPLVDSFFSSCTRTGNVPDSIEIARLNQFQDDCETEIGRLDKQITETETTVLQSCRELAPLKEKPLQAARSFCAPIRTLPPEVLNIVFEMCLPEGFYRLNKRKAPLVLCHVCKLWQDIAICNPLLWNSPRFNLSVRSLDKYGDLLRTILDRARTKSLYLQLWDNFSYSETPSYRGLLGLFAVHFPKCKMLDLVIASRAWYRDVCQLDVGGNLIFETLQSLSLCIRNNLFFPRAVERLCIFKNTPKLDQVYLELCAPSFLQNIAIPYSQLLKFGCSLVLQNTLDLTGAISIWKTTLSKCTKVESIKVAFLPVARRVSIGQLHPQAVVLASVRALTVTVDIYGNIDPVFEGLKFEGQDEMSFDAVRPCELKLDLTTLPVANMHFTLPALGHTFFGLSRLILLRVFIADKSLLPVFQTTSNLRYLEILNLKPCNNPASPYVKDITWIDDDSQLLDLITGMTATSPEKLKNALLPNLVHLHLYYPRHQEDHREQTMVYANLVQARSAMNLVMKENSPTTDPHFILELSFSNKHHSESVISSVLAGIDHANCYADVRHKVVDNFNWEVVGEEYIRLFL